MREFNASISLVKNYIRTLEKIIDNLLYLKQTSSNVIGSDEAILSKKIDDEISKGMNIQNNTNILMKNITEILKILKEEVIIKFFINYIIIFSQLNHLRKKNQNINENFLFNIIVY